MILKIYIFLKRANGAQSRCGKFLETYPERLTDVITAKGAFITY
jgi:hypothetical protein